jgi:hypothetical protein
MGSAYHDPPQRESLRAPGIGFPMEIGADVGAPLATDLAGKPRLDIGQPDVIRSSIAADCRRMAAPVVRAIDQETANASGAHLSEGDLLAGEGGHAPLKRVTIELATKGTLDASKNVAANDRQER